MIMGLSDLFKQYGARYFLLLSAAIVLSIFLYSFAIDSQIEKLIFITNRINGFTLLSIILIFLSAWSVSPFFNYILLATIVSFIFLSFNLLYYRTNYNLAHLFSVLSQLVQLVSILMVFLIRSKKAILKINNIFLTFLVTFGISFLLIKGKNLFTIIDQDGKLIFLDHGMHLFLFFIAMLAIVFLLKDERIFRQPYMGCLAFSLFLKLPEQLLFLFVPSHESEILLFAHVLRLFSSFSLLVVAYIVGISMPAKRSEHYQLELEKNLNEIIRLHSQNIEEHRKTMKRKAVLNQSIHDLKNPLSVIVGSLALLESSLKRESTLDPIYQKYLSLIAKNNIQTLTVLNHLSEIDEPMNYDAPLYLNNHGIVEIIDSIIFELSQFADRKRQSIKFKSMSTKKMIRCDREVVEQIIHNLLVGAITLADRHQTIHMSLEETDTEFLIRIGIHGNRHLKNACKAIIEQTNVLVLQHQGNLTFVSEPDGIEEVLLLLPQELTL